MRIFLAVYFIAFAHLTWADDFIIRSLQFMPEQVHPNDNVVITALVQVRPEYGHGKNEYVDCLPGFVGTGLRDERGSSCSITYLTNAIIEVRITEKISRDYQPGTYKLYRLILIDQGPDELLHSVQVNTNMALYEHSCEKCHFELKNLKLSRPAEFWHFDFVTHAFLIKSSF